MTQRAQTSMMDEIIVDNFAGGGVRDCEFFRQDDEEGGNDAEEER